MDKVRSIRWSLGLFHRVGVRGLFGAVRIWIFFFVRQVQGLTMSEVKIAELERENTHLRAALATSKDPCIYCQLPAEEMAKCRSGFPGCARADDMSGCPEFGAMHELHMTQELLREAARHVVRVSIGGEEKTQEILAGRCPLPPYYTEGGLVARCVAYLNSSLPASPSASEKEESNLP